MFSINAKEIHGAEVILAPMGTEVDRTPCLVYHDPGSMVEYCRVEHRGQIVTAKTERGLRGAAKRLGLRVAVPRIYLP